MKTVIFDLDGTLVDTSKDITLSINHIREKCYGLPPLESETIVKLMNTPGLNLAYEFYGVDVYEAHAKEMFEEHYAKQCLQNAKLFKGVKTLLKSLKSEGVKMFVATNAPTSTSKIILENNDVANYFEDVVGADKVVNPKPHPEMVEKIVGSGNKESYWMVGDSFKDMIAAKGAGVKGILALWGFDACIVDDKEIEFRVGEPMEVLKLVSV